MRAPRAGAGASLAVADWNAIVLTAIGTLGVSPSVDGVRHAEIAPDHIRVPHRREDSGS